MYHNGTGTTGTNRCTTLETPIKINNSKIKMAMSKAASQLSIFYVV